MLKSAIKQNCKSMSTCRWLATKWKFPNQKDLSRTGQSYVGRTAIKVNTTDTHLDLFVASWITKQHLACNSCKSTI